jgi:metallo-beta-lactamase class B
MVQFFMKYLLLVCAAILFYPFAALCQDVQPIKVNSDIELIKLGDGFYVHTTWFDFPGYGRTPSNGLILIKNGKALMIDTPVTNEQTEALYNYLKNSMHAIITKVIVGHSHSDCLGGLSYLHNQNVESISGEKTKKICVSQGLPIPRVTFSESMEFQFEGEKVSCRYFGGGHTIDNIVVYFPGSKVLFGGCLIKSLSSKGLGNIQEAVIDDWDKTVIKVRNEYPEARYVIPGHGEFGDTRLLTHTIGLVEQYREVGK